MLLTAILFLDEELTGTIYQRQGEKAKWKSWAQKHHYLVEKTYVAPSRSRLATAQAALNYAEQMKTVALLVPTKEHMPLHPDYVAHTCQMVEMATGFKWPRQFGYVTIGGM